MSGSQLKEKTRALDIDASSRYAILQKLILESFFDTPVSSEAVILKIKEDIGKRWKTIWIQTYMQKFMQAGIIHAIKPVGHQKNYWVLTSVTKDKALREIGKSKKVKEIEHDLFSDKLMHRLKKNFSEELNELHANFGSNGNCTAFLLRKILEKLIIIVFSKHGKGKMLEDNVRLGGWVGLKSMIETATREKIHGIPFLTARTADEIKGAKFLGDTAAHNPFVNVEMKTIIPQMPAIITAYEELARRL